ncbi:MAG: helix-hairpin-helix domain-containing protein [Actinobacteria bacterium]|jgi:competence protein ComEA|nr:helix-hairpin-helix domain-containing protein [Actinomycetota bacterium]
MDDIPPRLRRALVWLEATPAEAAGLAVLLIGALLATGMLMWQAFQRPSPAFAPQVTVPGVVEGADPGTVGAPAEIGDGGDVDDGHAHGEDAAGPLIVHVTGAVVRPGVVTLDAGTRVADAIAAAGGATGDARTDLLNLARPLQDGEHVHLPRDGEEPLPVPSGDGQAAGVDPTGLVDLNTATTAQLETLPGIGPAKAAAIVRHREEHGRFAVPGDLRDVPGIGEATFQQLADLVTVS